MFPSLRRVANAPLVAARLIKASRRVGKKWKPSRADRVGEYDLSFVEAGNGGGRPAEASRRYGLELYTELRTTMFTSRTNAGACSSDISSRGGRRERMILKS